MTYFGTDGIRGLYGVELTENLAYAAGRAAAAYFQSGAVVLGRDTRDSGESLAEAVARGLSDGGLEVLDAGILPTPAVSYLTDHLNAAAGVMISASHNPAEYNGIKFFGARGRKLTEEQEAEIEERISGQWSVVSGQWSVKGNREQVTGIGCQDNAQLKDKSDNSQLSTFNSQLHCALEKYIAHIVGQFDFSAVKGTKVVLDCGYGAAGQAAPEIFRRLGFSVRALFDEPRGRKINRGCGALHPENVKRHLGGAVFGFSFDGDADRLSVVYRGEELDGDSVIYNLSRAMTLKDDTVVGTTLNNLALEETLARDGKKLIRTDVGDKYISACMFQNGYNLGGEQSGHFIIAPDAQTGDGILAALWFMRSLLSAGEPSRPPRGHPSEGGEFSRGEGADGFGEPIRLKLYAQSAISEFAGKEILEDAGFRALIDRHARLMGKHGRILTRMSGTEPKVRVMAEGADAELVRVALAEAGEYIKQRKNER
ncbi:phosphoglucosamine mutase [Clostridia bacterium]|nr:phosphoglucosamine mutase [Clostridia bacterium]